MNSDDSDPALEPEGVTEEDDSDPSLASEGVREEADAGPTPMGRDADTAGALSEVEVALRQIRSTSRWRPAESLLSIRRCPNAAAVRAANGCRDHR